MVDCAAYLIVRGCANIFLLGFFGNKRCAHRVRYINIFICRAHKLLFKARKGCGSGSVAVSAVAYIRHINRGFSYARRIFFKADHIAYIGKTVLICVARNCYFYATFNKFIKRFHKGKTAYIIRVAHRVTGNIGVNCRFCYASAIGNKLFPRFCDPALCNLCFVKRNNRITRKACRNLHIAGFAFAHSKLFCIKQAVGNFKIRPWVILKHT